MDGPRKDGVERQREGTEERLPWLVYGLILGPGVGMVLALVLGFDLGLGLAFGGGLGVALGAALDSEHARRHPEGPTADGG